MEGEDRRKRGKEGDRERGRWGREEREGWVSDFFSHIHSLREVTPILGLIVELLMEASSKTLPKLPVCEDEEDKRMETFPIINL